MKLSFTQRYPQCYLTIIYELAPGALISNLGEDEEALNRGGRLILFFTSPGCKLKSKLFTDIKR